MVNDVHRIAHDLEGLHSHGYGISGGSALQAGLTLPSVAELGDTEETSSHEWTSRLRAIRSLSSNPAVSKYCQLNFFFQLGMF